ncbi:MAG: bifunctional methylenetetrahydrofolate dehydrogenase/methenyltetrahydrofolate cyclohydrolase FolD [Solirubrobacteraceae bacterium]|nr:bifunctional methylenetetrahydrofolate dehydrogenase/methenyltetrahydrofolate cyclohydrolase FolD [Solirubrobacteraceae bacterium]
MTATLIDGKQIAARVRGEVAADVAAFVADHGRPPGLATILVGEDAASAVYVGGKQRACAEVGIRGFDHRLAADAPREEVLDLVDRLNDDPDVSGILCQLPVPDHLDGVEITNRIAAEKDVDGLTVASAGRLALGLPGLRPCTPAGVIRLLDEAGTALEGAEAVVIGRSNLFGKPMAQLLLQRNATVTIAHSRTRDLAAVARRADVLVAAVGRPRMVGADWVKPGATVIDVGINRLPEGETTASGSTLVGDVDFDAAVEVAGAITPVPGGVGPMTIAELLANTVRAARMQAGPGA